MDIRHAVHPEHLRSLDTEGLRRAFLVEGLFRPDEMVTVYSHADRMIVATLVPVRGPIALPGAHELGAATFLERREAGVLNLGGPGAVTVDGTEHALGHRDALYVGRGAREVTFRSTDPATPARFYLNSAPAHAALPTRAVPLARARRVALGEPERANVRVIHQYIHPEVVESCQLVMGLTQLAPGSTWNTMPPHTHERRMEVYLYLDLPADAAVFHFLGRPEETRHLVVRNEQAVISPPWSIHCGVGTQAYAFVWGMAGENQAFGDMDAVPPDALR